MQERKSQRRKMQRSSKPFSTLVFWRNETQRFEADICDISVGGCFLNTAGNAAPGERIIVEVPGSEKGLNVKDITGTVVSQNRSLQCFGVRFERLDKDQRSFIDSLIVETSRIPDDRER